MEGMHGHYASSIAQNEADLIITAGARFSDRGTGNTAKYARNAKIIHIDIDASELCKNISVELGIAGSMKEILTRLMDKLPQQTHRTGWLVWQNSRQRLPSWRHRIRTS